MLTRKYLLIRFKISADEDMIHIICWELSSTGNNQALTNTLNLFNDIFNSYAYYPFSYYLGDKSASSIIHFAHVRLIARRCSKFCLADKIPITMKDSSCNSESV